MMLKRSKQKKITPAWHTILQQTQKISIPTTTAATYLAIIVILTTCSFCVGSPCQPYNWWDPVQDKCIPCKECEGQKIVLRPCQWHQDTVCGYIQDLEIDWMLLAQTEPNWKERRKEKIQIIESDTTQPEMSFDWQAASLILAMIACLLFFIVAGFILIHHMRHWRRMEQQLDRDVEELSAKLMARLAEVQNIESGSFLIENPIRSTNGRAVEVQCVYLQQLLDSKEAMKAPTRGNVYIEETKNSY